MREKCLPSLADMREILRPPSARARLMPRAPRSTGLLLIREKQLGRFTCLPRLFVVPRNIYIGAAAARCARDYNAHAISAFLAALARHTRRCALRADNISPLGGVTGR